MSAKLISIIGPPGVGKTTLARHLSDELPADFIREDFAGNPFLADSYLGRGDARLPGQLYFLMSRVQQLSAADWPADGVRVSDYGFCQDAIFARAKLDAAELALYEPVRQRLESIVHPPDVLIFLDAEPAVLLGRIHRRGRDFERVMTAEFLADMSRQYADAAAAAKCSVITLNSGQVDLRQETCRRELIGRIAKILGGIKNVCEPLA